MTIAFHGYAGRATLAGARVSAETSTGSAAAVTAGAASAECGGEGPELSAGNPAASKNRAETSTRPVSAETGRPASAESDQEFSAENPAASRTREASADPRPQLSQERSPAAGIRPQLSHNPRPAAGYRPRLSHNRPPAAGYRPRLSRNHAPALVWRHLTYEVRSGACNMALDHALAASMGGEGCDADQAGWKPATLRLYGWTRPTLSLGRNEPASAYPIDDLRAEGFDVVRRPTGGRAVLHHRELTYAVIAPLRAWGSVRDAYARINAALAAALRELGAPVDLVDGARGRALAPDAGPCFQVPAAGEVAARGRKIVGSAQARIGDALLQHGSILLAGDQGPLAAAAVASAPVTLRELIGDVSIDEVAGVVANSLRAGLGGDWLDGGMSASELALADELERERYWSDSWTFRR
ncbi:MAG: hypothetical protein FJ207_03535 [Gemmatimonadetes bacterium]|nr:hypothetical protein [Gemmatimonadota bacterium]